ncbi:MAG: CCA tRNA nucleotidyltransferase [Lachnospiraceae bacterium]|nr:CCA tRNA nucleotidyltransferase [Lachnospiraceae bacterium]
MKIQLPRDVQHIIGVIEDAGYEAYAVGGCVRDALLNRTAADWDITTSAEPMEIKRLFHRTIDVGLKHGTVTVLLGKRSYEVTTYRIDGDYEDARHPKNVHFTRDIGEDLKRRDFTINAMAYNERTGLLDLFSGREDLKNGIVRAVGDPMERFSEDALRILRAFRFAAKLGFSVEESTAKYAGQMALNLKKISAERIREELTKIVSSEHPEVLRELYRQGISRIILPEFDRCMETEQRNPHHCLNVGEHTIEAMRQLPSAEPFIILRLTMLFHDMGKPECHTRDEKGIDHFHGHAKISAQIAERVLMRLKSDRRTMELVKILVTNHDRKPALTKKGVRRLMSELKEAFPLLFPVWRADMLAQSEYKREEKLSYIAEVERLYREIEEAKDPVSISDLKINGRDLMHELKIEPGPDMGSILNRLLDAVLSEPELNNRDSLLALAREWK